MTLRGSWGFGFGLALLASSFSARAEEPAATPPAPLSGAETAAEAGADAAPDVVRLKNGGLLRGRISELIPGESVTIVTVTGKTREMAMSEVDYAGPVAKDPQAAPPVTKPAERSVSETKVSGEEGEKRRPYVTVHGKEARLHVVASEPGITFHRQAGSAVAFGAGVTATATGYERICTAPCEVSLPAGTETLALSKDQKSPLAAEPVTLPPGDSKLTGSIESRSGLRAAGWVVLIGGTVAGLAIVFTSRTTEQTCSQYGGCSDTPKLNTAQLLGGVALGGLSIGIGGVMARVPDKAIIEVTPSEASSTRLLGVARGVTFSGRF
jgi:hypothetical protein